MRYLFIGGPLDGHVKEMQAPLVVVRHSEPLEIGMDTWDPSYSDWKPKFIMHTYDRTQINLFGRDLDVYVWHDSNESKADLLFNGLVSSVVKSVVR